MPNSYLIIVEGIMGSGKTSTAEWIAHWLQQQGLPTRFVLESSAFRLRALKKDRAPTDPDPLNLSAEHYLEHSLCHWATLVQQIKSTQTIHVLDGYLFHAGLDELLFIDADDHLMVDYVERVQAVIAELHPVMIYLYQANVTQAVRQIFRERGHKWTQYQVRWKAASPYCFHRGLDGVEGFLQLYGDFRTLTDRMYNEIITCPRLAIDTSARNWPAYTTQIREFLTTAMALPVQRLCQLDAGDNTLHPAIEDQDLDLIGEDVLAFPKMTRIQGNLRLKQTRLTTLSPLSSVTWVGHNVEVWSNPVLVTLEGLQHIQQIPGSLICIDNPALHSLEGLNSLTSIKKGLFLLRNRSLQNLAALQQLTRVEGNVLLSVNPQLSTLQGCTHLTSIGGALEISDHARLLNLDGLQHLARVGQDLEISHNAALREVNGLRGLTHIGGTLHIIKNASLINLDGLAHLEAVQSVQIIENPQLPTACAQEFITQLKARHFQGEVIIEGNAG